MECKALVLCFFVSTLMAVDAELHGQHHAATPDRAHAAHSLVEDATIAATLFWPDGRDKEYHATLNDRSADLIFRVKNTGTISYTLGGGTTDCDCVTVLMGESVLSPGNSTDVLLRYRFGQRSGQLHKTGLVTFTTNDGRTHSVPLQARVKVPTPCTVKPGLLIWERKAANDIKTAYITLHPLWQQEIVGLHVDENFVSASHHIHTDVNGERIVTITAQPLNTSMRLTTKVSLLFVGDDPDNTVQQMPAAAVRILVP